MDNSQRTAIQDRPTILLVAEERTACGLLTDVLQDEGFAVVLAADSDEALCKVRTLGPDLILVDALSRAARDRMIARLRCDVALRSIPLVVIRRQHADAANAGQPSDLEPDLDTLLEHVWRMVNTRVLGASRGQ
jgi:CheY-like chemotaxis protein